MMKRNKASQRGDLIQNQSSRGGSVDVSNMYLPKQKFLSQREQKFRGRSVGRYQEEAALLKQQQS